MQVQTVRMLRKVHAWSAAVVALPLFLIIVTGILLIVRNNFSISPQTVKQGSAPSVSLSYQRILELSRQVPEAGVKDWSDIKEVRIHFAKGHVLVRAMNSWQIQLDGTTGEVLSSGKKWSDLIVQLHEGTFFHASAPFWVYLPTALVLLLLWFTGGILFYFFLKAKKADFVLKPYSKKIKALNFLHK
jgi:uncharacterized iron-regulated membrane protein